MKSDDLNNPFWQYSLEVYAKPEVAELCLSLQDEFGLDVNVLLFCGYLGSLGKVFPCEVMSNNQTFKAITALIENNRELRRSLKAVDLVLYEQAKSLELQLEKCKQGQMFRVYESLPEQADLVVDCRHNIALYLDAIAPSLGFKGQMQEREQEALLKRLIELL